MKQNDSDKKLDPLLVKNKAEENNISQELARITRILDERAEALRKTIRSLDQKNLELSKVKERVHISGFLTGDSSIVARIEHLKRKMLKELDTLKKKELEYKGLVDSAQKKLYAVQEQLELAYNSRRTVEKLKDVRHLLDTAVDTIEEDYLIEELSAFKRRSDT
jgi:hypothetical protein